MATSQPSSAILCIHGGESSPSIFRFQASRIRTALKSKFSFCYATAPHVAEPGPDVLPFFADMGPYYSWFREGTESEEMEVALFNKAVKKTVGTWERENPHAKIVRVLGFSQGGVASTVLMWQQQMGLLPWLPDLEFGILVCSGSSDVATGYMRKLSVASHRGEDGVVIKVPTLYLHGCRDVINLPNCKKMFTTHFDSETAKFAEFDGGHELPKARGDIEKLTEFISGVFNSK